MLAKISFTVLVVLACSLGTYAQERLGLKVGNYSGINGVTLNPASAVDGPLRWDINLVAAGVFVENNYTYFRDANLFRVLRNTNNITVATSTTGVEGTPTTPGGLILDFTRGSRRKFASVDAFVMGPSAMFAIKDNYFGIFFGARTVMSANRVPGTLGYYNVQALQVGDQLTVDKFKTAGAAYSEIGLNYGRNVLHHGKHRLNVGGTAKLLLGHDAYFFTNKDQTTITIQQDFMTYDHANVAYGVANTVAGYGGANTGYDFAVNGYGVAMDIGATYTLYSSRKLNTYTWKFGAALLDFGKIRYKNNAQQHEINTDSPFDFVQADYSGIQEFDNVYQVLSDESLQDQFASFSDTKFGLWTPAGISLQAERAFTDHVFINATVVRRLRFFAPAVARTNIISITPRYETRWFEVSLPLVLVNDVDPRMGLALRVGPLVVGTDNLPSMFGKQNFSGTDVYMAIKINPASLSLKHATKNNGRPDKPTDCYYF